MSREGGFCARLIGRALDWMIGFIDNVQYSGLEAILLQRYC
jgi:hypothetical protein